MGPADSDIVDPLLALPFNQGWRREVVYRANQSTCKVDIYYFAPEGKKHRSLKQLKRHLPDGLTCDNFSFKKKALGISDPSKEIVRFVAQTTPSSAKAKTSDSDIKNKNGSRKSKLSKNGNEKEVNMEQCHHCNYKTSVNTKLICHVATHAKVLLTRCPVENIESMCQIEKYKSTKRCKLKTFTCSKCSFTTSDSRYMSLHSRLHSIDTSNTKLSVDTTERNESRYACYHCTFKASKLSQLRKHVKAHLGIERYVCSDCDFRTNVDAYMRLHSRLHVRYKPYKCSKCPFDTSTLESLQDHLQGHNDDEKTLHGCPYCECQFSNLNELRNHFYSHSPNFKTSCVIFVLF